MDKDAYSITGMYGKMKERKSKGRIVAFVWRTCERKFPWERLRDEVKNGYDLDFEWFTMREQLSLSYQLILMRAVGISFYNHSSVRVRAYTRVGEMLTKHIRREQFVEDV